MAQNQEKPAPYEPKLCPKCSDMFGHPNFDNLCSACFKKEQQTAKVQTPHPKEQPASEALEARADPGEVPKLEEEGEVSLKRGLVREEEGGSVGGRCSRCSKKTSMLGYNCKHCSQEFCKYHRLPESHDCGVDFVSLGRKQIKTDNPIIIKKKIEHI